MREPRIGGYRPTGGRGGHSRSKWVLHSSRSSPPISRWGRVGPSGGVSLPVHPSRRSQH